METPGPSLSFGAIAARYDGRYQTPVPVLRECYRRLIDAGALPRSGLILDAGCGTGQMSLPLAEQGFEVRGYDIAPEMAAVAQAKVRAGWRAIYGVADVRRLPEGSDRFDGAVVSKLFPHISDWRAAATELLRVLRPGACLIHVNDGGALDNAVRSHFERAADSRGYKQLLIGLHPVRSQELAEFLASQGCAEIAIDVSDLCWEMRYSHGEVLDQFRDKLFGQFWTIPEAAYQEILTETARWADAQPQGRMTVEITRPCLHVQVFRKRL